MRSFITATLLTLASPAMADGIAEMLMPADPCGPYRPAIVEADTVAQAGLFVINCGRIPPLSAYAVAGYQNRPSTSYWRQPDPLPSPVPLPAAGWMMLAGLGILGVRKWA